jgi:MOB kinase activator 1
LDTGSIIGPYTKAQMQTPRNKGYFAGTSLLSSFFSNPRTRAPFKPQKTNRGTSSWQLKQYAEATLGSGSLRKAVKLPEGEDKDEWLAVNGRKYCGEREKLR